jgi:putative transposase
MRAAVNALLLLLAAATDRALDRYVQYLKAENQVLRSKLPKVVKVTPQEHRRLVKFGRPLGPAIKGLISIVSPRTFLRSLDDEGRQRTRRACPTRSGRPRTAEAFRELVLRLARENDWGYTRILGELRKLGVRKICRSCVVNNLREAALEPGPKRGEDTWDDFIKRHTATRWSCDFFSKHVWTLSRAGRGLCAFLHQPRNAAGPRRRHDGAPRPGLGGAGGPQHRPILRRAGREAGSAARQRPEVRPGVRRGF